MEDGGSDYIHRIDAIFDQSTKKLLLLFVFYDMYVYTLLKPIINRISLSFG